MPETPSKMETEKPTAEYVSGFNQGYIIGRDLPELSAQLKELSPDSDKTRGFIDGKKWALIERTKEKSLNRSEKSLALGRIKDQDKDRKDIELD